MSDIRTLLKQSIKSGEIIRIVYLGGSTPGREREIYPLAMDEHSVKARIFPDEAVKLFTIDKIRLPGEVYEISASPQQLHFASMQELEAKQRSELERLGWVVQWEGKTLSLHRTFKNGKLIKTPEVSLDFDEFEISFECTDPNVLWPEDDQMIEVRKARIRPWVVRAKGKDTKTYGSLDPAAAIFLEWANELSQPNKAQ